MNNLHKKSTTKLGDTSSGLTEKRVREIVREEITKWNKEHQIRTPILGSYDDIKRIKR
jgi:hypothetical protein